MKITKTIISNLETGTPEVPESKIPFLIGENSFIDMDVRAVNRKGNKIKLIPGNAKYPSTVNVPNAKWSEFNGEALRPGTQPHYLITNLDTVT